jgi:hypothetical protein
VYLQVSDFESITNFLSFEDPFDGLLRWQQDIDEGLAGGGGRQPFPEQATCFDEQAVLT